MAIEDEKFGERQEQRVSQEGERAGNKKVHEWQQKMGGLGKGNSKKWARRK